MNPTELPDPPKRLLLAFSNDPHSELAAQAARTLASDYDIDEIAVLHTFEEGADSERRTECESIIDSSSRTLEGVSTATTELAEVEDIRHTIIDHAADHDVTVFGAPTVGLLKRLAFGSVPDSVKRETVGTVLTARSHESSVQKQ